MSESTNFYLIKLVLKWKRTIRKGHTSFLAFYFLGFEIGVNRFSIKFYISNCNSFFSKIWTWYHEMQPNLKIQVKIFLRCRLWPTAAKMESVGNKIFLQEFDQESCELKRLCDSLIMTIWLVTLSCFLSKTAQIVQKVILFFPERGEEIEPWFWHILIAQWLIFFRSAANIFWFWPSSGGNRGSKLDQKCKFWVRPFSVKTQIFQNIFKQCFCLLVYYLWWEFQQNWTIFGGVRVQNSTTIMYLQESVNQKPLKARNSVFGLNFLEYLNYIKKPTHVMNDLAFHHW